MTEKIEALQLAAHHAATEGNYDKALEIFNSLQENQKVNTWDIVFYRCFYRYGMEEATAFSHILDINQGVIDAFAVVLSQNVDILETLVCFQDIYDQIWDLSTRLQQFTHREYIGLIKGKSITEEFHQAQTAQYIENLKKILSLSENFINALGNLSEYTTINWDLVWDFFQCNDGLFCFLLVYDGDSMYEEKRGENLKIIQLKRPDYVPVSLPTPVKPAEIRSTPITEPKKKGLWGRLFQ
ncbi:MAG: hypothetical protein R3Y63_00320 [Eubacteriales bacterium]